MATDVRCVRSPQNCASTRESRRASRRLRTNRKTTTTTATAKNHLRGVRRSGLTRTRNNDGWRPSRPDESYIYTGGHFHGERRFNDRTCCARARLANGTSADRGHGSGFFFYSTSLLWTPAVRRTYYYAAIFFSPAFRYIFVKTSNRVSRCYHKPRTVSDSTVTQRAVISKW